MAARITIRDVPEWVRDELAKRAAQQHKSMQEFLRAELERLAQEPLMEAWLQRVRKRKQAARTHIPLRSILAARKADKP